MLIFCDFIQVYVFTTNHHLKVFFLFFLCLAAILLVEQNDFSNFVEGHIINISVELF